MTPEEQALNLNPELQDVSRQRKLADLLMASGMQQPQGQMISGRYVAPSWSQSLNPIANILAGQAVGERADTKQLELATALRGKQQQVMQAYAQAKTPQEKFAIGTSEFAPPQLKAAAYEMLKPQKVGEGETISQMNMGTGAYEPTLQGGQKYRAPIQIDTGTTIELRDPNDPTKVISRMPKSQMPTAGQVVETENGPMLVNTRTGQAQPIMGAGGQAIAGNKPLTEAQGNATAFGMRAKQSNALLTELEQSGTKNTGVIRSTVAGGLGMTPFIGEKLEQGVSSAMNVLPGVMGGPNAAQQATDQARRNFVTAILRKESGAAISPSEFANEAQKYFPQPGDADSVIKQKQQARELAIKALEIQAGPGAKQIRELGTNTGVVDFNSLPKRGQ